MSENPKRSVDPKLMEERFVLQRKIMDKTAEWWEKEMDKWTDIIDKYNANPSSVSEEDREKAARNIKQLVLKAEWELKEEERWKKNREKFIYRIISERLSKDGKKS